MQRECIFKKQEKERVKTQRGLWRRRSKEIDEKRVKGGREEQNEIWGGMGRKVRREREREEERKWTVGWSTETLPVPQLIISPIIVYEMAPSQIICGLYFQNYYSLQSSTDTVYICEICKQIGK